MVSDGVKQDEISLKSQLRCSLDKTDRQLNCFIFWKNRPRGQCSLSVQFIIDMQLVVPTNSRASLRPV